LDHSLQLLRDPATTHRELFLVDVAQTLAGAFKVRRDPDHTKFDLGENGTSRSNFTSRDPRKPSLRLPF
jgi:hypothetical protein